MIELKDVSKMYKKGNKVIDKLSGKDYNYKYDNRNIRNR